MNELIKDRTRLKSLKYTSLAGVVLIGLCFFKSISFYNDERLGDTQPQKTNKSTKASQHYKLNINHSVFEGLSKDLSSYVIRANNVKKTNDNKYHLNLINAKYSIDNSHIIIKAASGTLDEETKFITLQNNVQITFDELILNCEKIKLDLNNKDASSDSDVEVTYKNSIIKADSFNTENSNGIINFEGNVQSKFDLKDF